MIFYLTIFIESYYWNLGPLLGFHLQISYGKLQNVHRFSWPQYCLVYDEELRREVRNCLIGKESEGDMLGSALEIQLESSTSGCMRSSHW